VPILYQPDGRQNSGPIEEGFSMSDTIRHRSSVTNLHTISPPPADEHTASMIDLLQEHLRLAREGKLRSLAVVSVSADGSAIGTQWSCDPSDMASLIGKLTVLTHDLMAARK
jgi:hypothetical protein